MSNSSPRRRAAYDAAASRLAILDAAEQIFAAHGFAGARVDQIAAQSGYNKSLLFQYFGDKLALYLAVLTRAEQGVGAVRLRAFRVLADDPALGHDPGRFRAALTSACAAVIDHLLAHPPLLRLLLWEMADGWQTYTRLRAQLPEEPVDGLEAVFAVATAAGLLRSRAPVALHLTLALQAAIAALSCLPLLDTQGATTTAMLRDHTVALMVASIVRDLPEA